MAILPQQTELSMHPPSPSRPNLSSLRPRSFRTCHAPPRVGVPAEEEAEERLQTKGCAPRQPKWPHLRGGEPPIIAEWLRKEVRVRQSPPRSQSEGGRQSKAEERREDASCMVPGRDQVVEVESRLQRDRLQSQRPGKSSAEDCERGGKAECTSSCFISHLIRRRCAPNFAKAAARPEACRNIGREPVREWSVTQRRERINTMQSSGLTFTQARQARSREKRLYHPSGLAAGPSEPAILPKPMLLSRLRRPSGLGAPSLSVGGVRRDGASHVLFMQRASKRTHLSATCLGSHEMFSMLRK